MITPFESRMAGGDQTRHLYNAVYPNGTQTDPFGRQKAKPSLLTVITLAAVAVISLVLLFAGK